MGDVRRSGQRRRFFDHGYAVSCASSDGGAPGSASAARSPITVLGLTNGDDYRCTVTATNAIGTSVPSAASIEFIPATAPDSPTNVSASRGTRRRQCSSPRRRTTGVLLSTVSPRIASRRTVVLQLRVHARIPDHGVRPDERPRLSMHRHGRERYWQQRAVGPSNTFVPATVPAYPTELLPCPSAPPEQRCPWSRL